jgi:hypothetical protein
VLLVLVDRGVVLVHGDALLLLKELVILVLLDRRSLTFRLVLLGPGQRRTSRERK